MNTQQITKIYPSVDTKVETWWELEINNIKLKVIQKKNKHEMPLEKVWVYTNSDGTAYYSTTSLATFSQKYWFEVLHNVKLVRNN